MSSLRKKLAAACFVLAGLHALMLYIDFRDVWTLKGWRYVPAVVKQADWQEYADHAHLTYEYVLDGQTYHSDAQSYADMSRFAGYAGLWARAGRWLSHLISDESTSAATRFEAQHEALQSPPGTALHLFCDPLHPERAIPASSLFLSNDPLETDPPIAGVLALVGLGFVVLGACCRALRGTGVEVERPGPKRLLMVPK